MSKPFKYEWERAVLTSPLPSTTRLVLMTLSTFMDKHGTGAFPSQQTVADMAHLGVRTVRKHLDLALKEGWLLKVRQGRHVGRGGSYSNMYDALIPLAAGTSDPPADDVGLSTTGTSDPPANPAGGTSIPQEAPECTAGGTVDPPISTEHVKKKKREVCGECQESGWVIAPNRDKDGKLLPTRRCECGAGQRRTA